MKTKEAPKKSQSFVKTWLGFAARIVVGAFFGASGLSKIIGSPESFAAAIEAYQVIPIDWALPLAKILPWLELLLGGYLLAGYLLRWACLGIALMLTAFLTALISIQLRGINLSDCGCFGNFGFYLDPRHTILIDLALFLATLWIYRVKPTVLSLDSWIERKS